MGNKMAIYRKGGFLFLRMLKNFLCVKSNEREDKMWPTDSFDHSQFLNSHNTANTLYTTYIQDLNGKY